MARRHWKYRQPRRCVKWGLVAILVPFLLVGCVSLDSLSGLFRLMSETCQIIDQIKKCSSEADKG